MTDEVWYTRSREEDWCFIKLCEYKKDREITKLKRMTTKLQKLQQLTTKLQSYNACRRHFMWTEPLIRRTEPVISLSKPLYLPPNHQPENTRMLPMLSLTKPSTWKSKPKNWSNHKTITDIYHHNNKHQL